MFQADSSIEYVINSINKNEEGAYIWLNNKKYFVRPLTDKEKNQEGLNDSLTMEIVRSCIFWKHSDTRSENIRTGVLETFGHAFRKHPDSRSGNIRTLL